MTNIEEMEGIKRSYLELSRPFREESRDYYLFYFMGFVIDSLKDLHEENCKLWKALAEMGYKEEIKEKFVTDKNDWEYPYEPNE